MTRPCGSPHIMSKDQDHSCYAYVCCHGVVDPSTGIKKRGKLVLRLVNARTNTFLWRGIITLLPSCPPLDIFIWAFSAVSCVGSLVSRTIPQLFLFSIILFYLFFSFCFFLFWCFRIIRVEVDVRGDRLNICKVSANEASKKVLFHRRFVNWVGWIGHVICFMIEIFIWLWEKKNYYWLWFILFFLRK